MKKKVLVIGAIAGATLLAGGLALAQSSGHGQGRMHGIGMGMHGAMSGRMHDQMGSGMRGQMGHGMHGQMGRGASGQTGPGMRGGHGLAQFDPAQLDTYKDTLGIMPSQEAVWTKYAKTVAEAATTGQTTRETVDRDAVRKMSQQDRLAFVTAMREQEQKRFETVQTAANELFATLDDLQKAKASDLLPGLASASPGATRNAMRSPRHEH